MARPVVELESLLKMVMGAGKISEIKAREAEMAVRDHSLGATRAGGRFAQGKLGHFAQWCGFGAVQMPRPKPVIGGEPFRGIFHPAGQFAGARKGGGGLRRVISLGPDQRIAEACL